MKKIAAVFLASLLVLPTAFAQWVPITPGQYMGSRVIGVIGDLAAVIGELATSNRAIEDEVVTTRVAFFNAPEGPARAEAARKFEEAMMKRDLHYVAQRIVNSARQESPLLVVVTDLAGSERVDGGLSPYSYRTFKDWADAVINSVSYKSPLDKALRDAMPQFEKYRAERDIVEMLFYNPQSPLRAANPKPGDYLAAWLLGTKDAKTFQEANASAQKIAVQVGPQRLAQIVSVLKSWSTIDNQISGPWHVSPRTALDPLIAGNPGEPYALDASARKITFAEARSDFSRWHTNLVPQLDEIEQLWNEGRVSKDLEALRLAVEKRDELRDLIKATQANRRSDDDMGRAQGDLMLTRLTGNLAFLDAALKMSELNAMKSGQINPLAEDAAKVTREYLAKSSKLQLRSITERQRMAEEQENTNAQRGEERRSPRGAPASGSPTTPNPSANRGGGPAPGPAAAPPSVDLGTPFDRAIEISQHPEFQDTVGVPGKFFGLAKSWEYWTTTTNRPFGWQHEVDKIAQGVEYEIIRQQQFLKGIADSVRPEQREQYEKHSGKRDSLRKELLAELERILPKLKQDLAAVKARP